MKSKAIENVKIQSQSTDLIKCLTECKKGEEVVVLSVNTGARAKQRLANLGILPGAKLTKKKDAPFKGPIGVVVKNSSLVIGRGLASKITVQCNNSCI
jgi:Fe2+ transport system protein FeoA